MSDKQKLVDIAFQVAMTMHGNQKVFKKMSQEEVGEWVAEQLKMCGYPTTPCGSSWGVLTDG